MSKGVRSVEKKYFLNNIGLCFGAREKAFNNFKNRIFPIKDKILTPSPKPESELEPEQTKPTTKCKIYLLKLLE